MKIQIQKRGNSLALRIPKSFAVESKIEQGSTVEVFLESGKIIIFPVAEPEFLLVDLLTRNAEFISQLPETVTNEVLEKLKSLL